MTRSERRLFRDTSVLGILLTITVVALDMSGSLKEPERFFYDIRARHFQNWTPPPTDKLIHLEIDDPSLELIGRWPWPRARLAEIIDELQMAGAKALAMDVIFSERSDPDHEELQLAPSGAFMMPTTRPLVLANLRPAEAAHSHVPPATLPATRPSSAEAEMVIARRIDNDALFAASLRRFGNVVVPVSLSLTLGPESAPSYLKMVSLLLENPELISSTNQDENRDVMIRLLREQGHDEPKLAENVGRLLLPAAEEAMFRRIEREAEGGTPTFVELRGRLLPNIERTWSGSALLNRLRKQYDRFLAVQSLRRFSHRYDESLTLMATHAEQATVREFSEAAGLTGFVDYIPLSDGTVRTVPLYALHRDYVFPQIGLSLACMMLGVDIHKITISESSVILPCPDGREIQIPVRDQEVERGTFATWLDIPWFGKSGFDAWRTMYDYGRYQQRAQFISMTRVWDICLTRKSIVKNNENAVLALPLFATLVEESDPLYAYLTQYKPGDLSDPDAFSPAIDRILKWAADNQYTEQLSQPPPEAPPDADEETRRSFERTANQMDSFRALREIRAQNRGLQNDLVTSRASLRRDLEGKALLMGYTAVGLIADQIPTSLHPRCPGMIVHGVIFNSIMTGDFWKATPLSMRIGFIVIIGLMTTAAVATLPAWKALTAAALILIGYLLFNGYYLFDYNNMIVGVSGPFFAGVTVWAGGTLARYVLEASERRRVQTKFSSYADKVLVDYVINNPNVKLDGQKKELSVVFTDLQGFTTLSEALGEKTVQMLNEYMGLMVPVIRDNHGYLNKFLGDGIMYFFGAPIENARHAQCAVRSVLEMQDVMRPYNHALVQRGLPTLVLRAGITTGEMVVGDAGPQERSDYTVLGDKVNLAARLEGANKATGTKILMNARCRELVGDEFVCRPIAKLQVKGKTEGVMTYEAMAFAGRATEQHLKLAVMSEEVVKLFTAREFARSLEVIDEMEKMFGPGKFVEIYREHSAHYLKEAPPEGWMGEIALSEK